MREDWIECNFVDIIETVSTANYKIKQKDYQGEGNFAVIDQGQELIGGYHSDPKYILPTELPVIIFGDHTKCVKYVNFEFIPGADGVKVIRPNNYISAKFLYYIINVLASKIDDKGYARHYQFLQKEKIFLPSLPEQRAIVKKIEQLFSSLDASISDLKKAKEQLKIYRQAVLKKAFDKVSTFKRIDEIGKVETGATPKRGENKYWQQGVIPWITSGALNHDFVFECNEYITNIALKETNCRLIQSGALLIAMYGEGKTRGKCSELKIDAATNQAIASISIFEEYLWSKKYVKLFLQKNYEDIRLLSSGGVQPNLNLSIIKSTIIPFPNQEIQHQIVKEIESRLSVCDAVEEQIKASLDKAEALRQSILKKAFAGALLTQQELEACRKEPDYEPASVLLEKIKAEKQNGKKKTEKEKAILPAKPIVAATGKVSADIQAGLIAKVIRLHEDNPQHHTLLTHVKCEKLSHLVEYHLQIPLGRQPVKDAAGPDDYKRLKAVEHRAKMAGYFSVQKNKIGYTYVSGKGIGKAITQFEKNLSEGQKQRVDQLLHLFLTFDLEQAEIVATVYAAWNNLLILGKNKPTHQEIVQEARYNWSDRKLGLEEHRFYKAIEWMQKDTVNLVPTGYGTLVDFPKNKK